MMSHEITETSGPIEERESNNILKRSLKSASKYWKPQTRKETITLTIPAELLEGDNGMAINAAELRRQCEEYVKKRLETSLRMSNIGMVIQQKQDDSSASSWSTALEVPVDDDGAINQVAADRKKPRRNDTVASSTSGTINQVGADGKKLRGKVTVASSTSGAINQVAANRKKLRRKDTVASSTSEMSASEKKPDPPAADKGDQPFRDKCIQSRDRCMQTFTALSTRSIQTFDDLSERGFRTFEGLTRRQLLYVAAGLILFIIINIVIGIATSDKSHPVPASAGPTKPPSFDLYSGSGEYLLEILDEMEPLDKDAFNWLKNIDSWEPPRESTNIDQLWIERYVLASFYFSTVTSDMKWKSSKNWLSGISVCVWQGVKCNMHGEISEIVLSHNQIIGSIPREIGQKLTSLEKLKLDSNELSNGIPSEFGNLKNLKHLDLYYNFLSGTLPAEIGMLSNLTGLYLRGNMLTGDLPNTFGGLVSLTELQLSDNKFRGKIGRHLGSLTNLVTLVVDRNRFSGSLPPELGKLTRLKWLRMDENEITGSIPIDIGYLTALQTIIIGNNKITGTLPRDLSGLTKLHQLDLRWNNIQGSVPPGIKRLSSLWHLNLSTNKFNGMVPELPVSLAKQDYKNGPFCSLAGNYFLETRNGEELGCKINGQRELM